MRNLRTVPQLLFRVGVLPVFLVLQALGRVSGLASEAKTLEGPYRRQPFLVGRLAAGIRKKDAVNALRANGFFFQPFAYPDPGQVASLRKLDERNPVFQYHVRIFEDGEVRAHYEYTPEDHPWKHLDEYVLEDCSEGVRTALRGLLSGDVPRS